MARNEMTPARYTGQVCFKHPEFNGLRLKTNRNCVQCHSRYTLDAAKVRYATRPEVRAVSYRKNRKYGKAHPWLHSAAQVRRQAAKLKRTPSWADHEKINEFYRLAAESGLTVDHIIPMQGDLVSGLHVENNLQLLTREQNSAKGNKYVP